MKNTLEGINSTLGDMEECISDLEDRRVFGKSLNQISKKKKKLMSLRALWNNNKCTNIYIIEISEGEERKGQKMYLMK